MHAMNSAASLGVSGEMDRSEREIPPRPFPRPPLPRRPLDRWESPAERCGVLPPGSPLPW